MSRTKMDFLLLNKRILLVDDAIEDSFATSLITKLRYLNNPPFDDVFLLIDSPGGLVTSSFAVYDTMRWCKYRIVTVCLHRTAALATLLLAAGSKGKRYAFTDSLIKPALYPGIGNNSTLYTDKVALLNSIMEKAVRIYASLTNNNVEVMRTICTTDHTLSAEEAQKYGYIDNIISLGPLGKLTKIDYFDVVEIIRKFERIESCSL